MHSKIIFGDSRSMPKTKTLTQALINHKEINDRFTFDDLIRLLLRSGFTHEEAKNVILNNCTLSALVFQERVENNFYLEISERMSNDLVKLYADMFNSKVV